MNNKVVKIAVVICAVVLCLLLIAMLVLNGVKTPGTSDGITGTTETSDTMGDAGVLTPDISAFPENGSTDPTNIENLTDPTNPANPTNPTNPANPTNPTNPANPTNPTNHENPTNPGNGGAVELPDVDF